MTGSAVRVTSGAVRVISGAVHVFWRCVRVTVGAVRVTVRVDWRRCPRGQRLPRSSGHMARCCRLERRRVVLPLLICISGHTFLDVTFWTWISGRAFLDIPNIKRCLSRLAMFAAFSFLASFPGFLVLVRS